MPKTPYEIDQILDDLRNNYIRTDRDRMIRDEIDRLLRRNADGELVPVPAMFSGGKEARGIVLTGWPGEGKSTTMQQVLSTHPALGPSPDGPARYLSVKVPSPATLKSFGCEILRATGYSDISERRERWSIWNLVRHRLAVNGYVCLVVDEAHDLQSAGSQREAMDILSAFKSLLAADPPVIVILMGIPIFQELVSIEGQTQRRYAKLDLPPVTLAADGQNLRKVLQNYCARADLEPPTGDIVPRLIHASRMRFGLCVENIVNAIELALRVGDSRLEPLHFAESWATVSRQPSSKNPFIATEWSKIDLCESSDKKTWRYLK